MNERTLYRIDKIILILIFILSIYIPLVAGVIQQDKISSRVEKRNLAKFPPVPESLKALSEYPDAFNKYYSDHFGFREVLIQKYFKIVNKLGSQSAIDDITMGQDGWMFLGSFKPGYKKFGDPIGDAININLFTNKELEDFASSIVTIKNWLSNKGIKYVYVIAPNKHTIYFDKLPKYISKKNTKSATDQIVEYLQKHTDVAVVDLRPTLMEERKKHQVYYKSDTHWNHYGANVAQFEIMNKIKLLLDGKVSPTLLTDTQFEILSSDGGDLAKYAKIENIKEANPQPIFEEGCTPVSETPDSITYTTVCETQELNAVIFRDSFFVTLHPYISRKFRRSTYILELINYNSLRKYVEQENPDIVIDEVVERVFPYIPKSALFNNAP